MTWKRFLAALVAGGWSTDVEHDVPHWTNNVSVERVMMRATRGDTVIDATFVGVGRKFDGVSINDTGASVERLEAVLADA